jgi:hypothetical protein
MWQVEDDTAPAEGAAPVVSSTIAMLIVDKLFPIVT